MSTWREERQEGGRRDVIGTKTEGTILQNGSFRQYSPTNPGRLTEDSTRKLCWDYGKIE